MKKVVFTCDWCKSEIHIPDAAMTSDLPPFDTGWERRTTVKGTPGAYQNDLVCSLCAKESQDAVEATKANRKQAVPCRTDYVPLPVVATFTGSRS